MSRTQMIFLNHPAYIGYYKDLKMIGYWYSKWDPDFPMPQNFVDKTWDETERQLVIKYLKTAKFYEGWMGWSSCRFCEQENGSTCLTDGVYVFPEGFAHYIEEHNVKPDQEFIDHIINKGI